MADQRNLIEFILSGKDEATNVFERVSGSLEKVQSRFEGIKTLLAAGLGFEVINETVGGIEDLAKGLITANQNAENIMTTLKSVYGSASEAQQAFAFLQSNEQIAPFDLANIQQAALTLASMGADITTALPAVEALSAVMSQPLAVGAQATLDAFEGRFAMIQRDLHVSKDQLVAYGLQVDATGHVLQSSFLPALEKFAATRFPDAMTNAMHTMSGELSSMHTQFYLLEQEMGKDVFGAVKDQIFALTRFMQENRTEIAAYAAAFGQGLAEIGGAVFETARVVGSVLPIALHVAGAAFGAVGTAGQAGWHLAEQAISTFVGWFQNNALPLIYAAIGAISTFWEDHGRDVRAILNGLGKDVQVFGTFLATNLANAMTVVEGVFNVGWGTVTAIVGGAISLLSGNFSQFGRDIDVGTNQIMKGMIQSFSGILAYVATWAVELIGLGSTIMVPVANAMMAPWTKLAQGVRTVFEGIGGFLGDFVGIIAKVAADVDNKIAQMINSAVDAVKKAQSFLPERLQIDAIRNYRDIGLKESSDQVGLDTAKSISDWFKRNAPGIDANQQITAGVSQDQARADIAAAAKAILDPVLADIHQTTAALLKEYGLTDAQMAVGFGGGGPAKGQQQVDDFTAWLKKLLSGGPNLPALPNAAGGQLPGPGGLPVPGMAGGDDPKAATAALKAAYDQARLQFELDEKTGASVTKLLQDVAAVSVAQEKEGTNHTQILLDQQNNLASIVSTETARFAFDQSHGASLAALLADIKNIALAERAAGYSPEAIAADVARLTKGVLPAAADPANTLSALKDHLTRLENEQAGTVAIRTFEQSIEKFMTANQSGLHLSNDQLANAIFDLRQSIKDQSTQGPQGLSLSGFPTGLYNPDALNAGRGSALFQLGIARQGESQQIAILLAQLDQDRQIIAYQQSLLRATQDGTRLLELSNRYLQTIAGNSRRGEGAKQGNASGYYAGGR